MLRIRTRATLALAFACALGACNKEDKSEQLPAAEPAAAPSLTPVNTELKTWRVRFDDPAADAGVFQMTEKPGGGWVIKTGTGGAAVNWRDGDMVDGGAFQVGATFATPPVANAKDVHGILVGGQHLKDPDQAYTAFLIRGTGEYTIVRHEGAKSETLEAWTAHPSIRNSARAGEIAPNTLEIRVEPDVTRFLVNGSEVKTLPTDQVRPYGNAGLRVEGGADVTLTSFEMSARPAAPAEGAAATPAPR